MTVSCDLHLHNQCELVFLLFPLVFLSFLALHIYCLCFVAGSSSTSNDVGTSSSVVSGAAAGSTVTSANVETDSQSQSQGADSMPMTFREKMELAMKQSMESHLAVATSSSPNKLS